MTITTLMAIAAVYIAPRHCQRNVAQIRENTKKTKKGLAGPVVRNMKTAKTSRSKAWITTAGRAQLISAYHAARAKTMA